LALAGHRALDHALSGWTATARIKNANRKARAASMEPDTPWGQEWVTLQGNFERYEVMALAIKLVAVLLFFVGAMLGIDGWLACLLLVVLWLQEAICKTFQSRLGQRLLQLEAWLGGIESAPTGPAFQLHSTWQAGRKGAAGLLAGYAASACRPTVAFPYAVLLLAVVLA